ncbi:siphovirus Gp157 family protein [Nitratireductor basaltis]|uniref:Siphovirus Gp157 n=1 Tax=Nitratireductor basaltis TaxID=472175 RepID=A0A084UDN9_9HYPH|nr:siphovirus Gp157 family protein [Nitratireductor basaltis]KFB11075.1 hypothetical protein EL18_02117 [Nitratireductor basaltis]
MSALYVDAAYLKHEITRIISDYPELAGDEDLRADMLEGETDLNRVVGKALNARQEAASMAEAIKSREEDLKVRRARFEKKADAMKALIQSVMESANLDKLTLPEATLSIRKPLPKVEVTDTEQLPQGFYKLERKADKTALKQALMSGEQIPGAELALGDDTLSIRVK